MVKVVLRQPVRYPFGFDNVYRMGTVLDVSEEDAERLREMGVIHDDDPDDPDTLGVETPADDLDVEDAPEVEKLTGKKYPQLPNKTAGVNVWREYARDNEIDVRGLSEKSELMGHIIKVVSS